MKIAAFAAILLLAACGSTKSTPTPGNGTPDGATYPQTAEDCAAQPDSVWCKPLQ